MNNDNKLEFTGERFTPECVREIWYEHYHRYTFAKRFVNGKIVLDAACGEGYGSHLLAKYAKKVIGIDIDEQSIIHAKQKYLNENLAFENASCTNLDFLENSFDVVVSFETLEHLAEQEQMLAEFARILKPDGILLISTPDKKHYSDASGFTNEYHVKELYQDEFKTLLDKHWKKQYWYSQAMSFNSIIERHDSIQNSYSTEILNKENLESDEPMLTPMYYLVIATNSTEKIDHLIDLHLFADKEQSVYEHYNKTIKDYIYLANKHNELIKKVDKWLSIPILGKIIHFLNKRQ
jgi:ubiquinone/menaquinone biosynthesis C-methylase UbiE